MNILIILIVMNIFNLRGDYFIYNYFFFIEKYYQKLYNYIMYDNVRMVGEDNEKQ